MLIALPPFDPAVNEMDAEALPYAAEREVGADGVVLGVTDAEVDAAPAPLTFTAFNVTLYVVPLVRPVMVTGLDVTGGLNAV